MENFIPILSAGNHAKPSQGACVMEMVSFLAGEDWSDTPECSNKKITYLAQLVNDSVDARNRHLILKDFDRLFNTNLSINNEIRFAHALDTHFGGSPTSLIRFKANRKSKSSDPLFRDKMDMDMLDVLTGILDVFDEMFDRKSIEKQDLNALKALKVGAL